MNKPLARSPAAGAKHKAGRTRKTARIEARLSPYVLKVVKRAAEIQGRSISDFVVAAAEEAAEKALRNIEAMELTLADQEAFAAAMLNPPKPSPVWDRAFERYRRLVRRSE